MPVLIPSPPRPCSTSSDLVRQAAPQWFVQRFCWERTQAFLSPIITTAARITKKPFGIRALCATSRYRRQHEAVDAVHQVVLRASGGLN